MDLSASLPSHYGLYKHVCHSNKHPRPPSNIQPGARAFVAWVRGHTLVALTATHCHPAAGPTPPCLIRLPHPLPTCPPHSSHTAKRRPHDDHAKRGSFPRHVVLRHYQGLCLAQAQPSPPAAFPQVRRVRRLARRMWGMSRVQCVQTLPRRLTNDFKVVSTSLTTRRARFSNRT